MNYKLNMRGFKSTDLLLKTQNVPKFIHTIEQTRLVEWINWECDRAMRELKRLRFEINCQFSVWNFFNEIEQHLVSGLIDNNRDESVLKGIAAKNIGKGC